MTENRYRKVACPSCGAPLLFDDNATTMRCQFCSAVVERPEADRRPARPEPAESGPSTGRSIERTIIIPSDSSPPSRSSSSVGILLFVSGGILALGLVLALVFAPGAPETILKPALNLVGPVASLPTGAGRPPDFIAMGYDFTAENYPVARVDPSGHRIVWRGPAFESISDVSALAAGDGRVVLAAGTRLQAYDAADGKALWQADLSDQVGYCSECLTVRGDRVIALTRDYVIQAFDAAGGGPVWTRRMNGYTSGFSIWEDALLVVDREDEAYSLFFLSLKDGSVQRKITPACKGTGDSYSEELDNVSVVVPDPAGLSGAGALYLFYGWYPGCVEMRDLSAGKLLWQHYEETGFSPSGDLAVLPTGKTVFFAADNKLWAAAAADGETRLVAEMQDYEPVPLALAGDTLIVRVKRTRGTARYEIWGMDPASGEKIWEHAFKVGGPLDPPEPVSGLVDKDQWAWTWRMSAGGLAVLEFQTDPNQLAVTRLDPNTGSALGGQTVGLSIDDDSFFIPKVLAWQDPLVWVEVDNRILGVDFNAGKIPYSYP
jgi:outer membrane protein assembly factor BamB